MTIGKLFAMTLALLLSHPIGLRAAEWQNEWDKTLEAAKKEGMVVFASAADAELRRQLEPALKRRLSITLEYAPGRAAVDAISKNPSDVVARS